jgi:outer membrane receptor protein involved in Fe transport
MYRFAAILIGLLLLTSLVFGGTTGKLAGKVINTETGKPLAGANVFIEGTRLGAATDLDGEYYIINVPAGRYSVTTSSLGYQSVTVRNILITADFTTTYDFELSTKILEAGKEVVVVAERPLVETDRTSSVQVTTSEEIQNLPVRGYKEVVALQSGVTEFEPIPGDAHQSDDETQGARLQIRGGRPNEVGYWVDGFSQTDPQTGFSTTAINNSAIQEVVLMTGGFSAEYGRIMSGAVNVITKSGTSNYSGSLEAVTDNVINNNTHSTDYNVYAASLGGPIIPGNDRFTYYLSGERRWQGDRNPSWNARNMNAKYLELTGGNSSDATYRLPGNSLSGWTYQGKLKIKVTDAIAFDIGALGSKDDWRQFRTYYLFDINHGPRYVDTNNSFYGKITHTLSKNTFYTAAVNYYETERKRGDGVYFDNLLGYARESNPSYDAMTLFFNGIGNGNADSTYTDSTGTHTIYREHVWDDYLHRKSAYWGFKTDLTHQMTTHHQFKAGFDIERHTLRYWRHLFPVDLFHLPDAERAYLDVDHYGFAFDNPEQNQDSGLDGAKHPITMAVFLQDKVEYQGLVINAGVRYDYLDVATKRLISEDYPLDPYRTGLSSDLGPADLEPSKIQQRVSPRLGVGFPVSDKMVMHFSYGKFFQQPNLDDLYVSYQYLEHKIQTGGYFYPFGNPNLEPEKTTAYEVGFTEQVGQNVRFDITAYYKDITDLVEVRTITSFPNSFSSYRNTDFGTVKGIDLNFTMRRTHNFSANASYGLMYAVGTGSASVTQRNIAWTGDVPPKMTAPLDFDQRHKITLNLDYRLAKESGPIWGSMHPLENAGLNVVFSAASGLPYTPEEVWNEVTLGAISPTPAGPINSRYAPWTWRVDLKADKTFYFKRLGLDVYVWVLNAFNTQNWVDVFSSSGIAGNDRWLSTPEGQAFVSSSSNPNALQYYQLAQSDPTRYGVPRQIRIGAMLTF